MGAKRIPIKKVKDPVEPANVNLPRTPQVHPNLKKKGPIIGGSYKPRGG